VEIHPLSEVIIAMSFNEVFEGFKKLNAADRQRLIDAARQFNRFNNASLRYGAKVQFKHSRTGVVIEGTFVKMKQKYAEVMSDYNQHGTKQPYPVRWSVSPEMLIPVPAKV
jgi:hypothetical protein